MVVNIHRINHKNCGDMSASPLDYFTLPQTNARRCISFLDSYKSNEVYLFGGGGLFYHEWEQPLRRFAARKKSPAILWGAGLNYHQLGPKACYPDFVNTFDLAGVRDYGHDLPWVPCPSCMHPAFDRTYKATEEAVVFEHIENSVATDLPKFVNNRTMEEAVAFLASAEHVLTNSYHGVYWATLLGKKVIAIPVENSSRFYFFKHPPLVSDSYTTDFSRATCYPESLQECRQANLSFYKEVKCFLSKSKIHL